MDELVLSSTSRKFMEAKMNVKEKRKKKKQQKKNVPAEDYLN